MESLISFIITVLFAIIGVLVGTYIKKRRK